jgi:molybdopterin synthase sulfur carrier subunit
MAVSIRIPTILRTYTDGASVVEASGDTLTTVLDDLDTRFPGLRARVVDDSGALRRFVNVYVNDNDVRFSDGLATPIGDGATVSVIPAVAGG